MSYPENIYTGSYNVPPPGFNPALPLPYSNGPSPINPAYAHSYMNNPPQQYFMSSSSSVCSSQAGSYSAYSSSTVFHYSDLSYSVECGSSASTIPPFPNTLPVIPKSNLADENARLQEEFIKKCMYPKRSDTSPTRSETGSRRSELSSKTSHRYWLILNV